MGRCFLLLALIACALPAQTPKKKAPARKPAASVKIEPPAPKIFLIEIVRVEGSRLYPVESIAALTGLVLGQPGDQPAFEAARDRLVASGAFESVAFRFEPAPSGKGFAVTFEVAEIAQVFPVRFDRLPAPETDLREALRRAEPLFGDRIPGTRTIMERCQKALEAYFAAKSQPLPIGARLTGDRPEELYVLFHPAGAPPVVAEVHFRGNKVLPATVLQKAVHGVAVGAEYRESSFRLILDASVRPLYEERGRIRVAFPKIEANDAKDVKGVSITVEIDDGPAFNLNNVSVEGTQTLNKALVEAADLKTGDVANFREVEEGRQRIEARMRRAGYMKVSSRVERVIDDAARKVDLVLHVDPGPEFRFGKLSIQGLDLHGEAAVRKIWAMEPGKTFNPEYPDYFLGRIREDGLFDNLGPTRSAVKLNDPASTADVTLIFLTIAPPKK